MFTHTNRHIFEDKQLILSPQLTGQKFDFQNRIDYPQERCLVYLDPPYYAPRNPLYHGGLTVEDHERLAASLHASHHLWLLSYDDCPEIRELYQWATIEEIEVPYCMSKDKKQTALLIYPCAE